MVDSDLNLFFNENILAICYLELIRGLLQAASSLLSSIGHNDISIIGLAKLPDFNLGLPSIERDNIGDGSTARHFDLVDEHLLDQVEFDGFCQIFGREDLKSYIYVIS